MQAYIGQFYMTLGRLEDAERHLQDSGDLDDLLTLAEIREDLPAMRSYLRRLSPRMEAHRLVKAGLIEEARARLETQASDPLEKDIDNIGRAALASATGSPETAIPLLREILRRGAPHLSVAYQTGCELLAAALVRVDRRAEAMTELEQCGALPPRFFGRFNATVWMKNQVQLAGEYRMVGRTPDAERIEQHLRQLLVFADADHPMVVRLRQVR